MYCNFKQNKYYMRSFNKEELLSSIDKISIEKKANQVVTKYDNQVLKVVNVSDKYEVFDITSYLHDTINQIEENFKIDKYDLMVKGGIQYLKLRSEKIEVGGINFYKSFFILNSSDKSRRLRFNIGLISDDSKFYIVDNNEGSFNKKHLKGVTKSSKEYSLSLKKDSFENQIKGLKSLVGQTISLSNIRKVILGEDENVKNANHLKFDAFSNLLIKEMYHDLQLNNKKINFLKKGSKNIVDIPSDLNFNMDAFKAFQVYMKIFNKKDSLVVEKETSRIFNLTRYSIIESLLKIK